MRTCLARQRAISVPSTTWSCCPTAKGALNAFGLDKTSCALFTLTCNINNSNFILCQLMCFVAHRRSYFFGMATTDFVAQQVDWTGERGVKFTSRSAAVSCLMSSACEKVILVCSGMWTWATLCETSMFLKLKKKVTPFSLVCTTVFY